MTEFKVGDKVKIRKDSEYYGTDDVTNPADKEGEVVVAGAWDHGLEVRWDGAHQNSYRPEDLELAKPPRPYIKWI